MSNVLRVNEQATIESLSRQGWSQRRIATELGLNRRTVRRYASKCTTEVPAGTRVTDSKCTTQVPAGSVALGGAVRSRCAVHRDRILEKVESGLSAQRIWQDLREEVGFEDSYDSVKRYVRRLKARQPHRVWRVECEPGEEMQVDFGLGAMIEEPGGKRRRSWVLRATLSHSRKSYSEAVLRQDTETFLRCVENALRHFGGAPLMLNLDNLKAGVIRADWWDPELNPKLADFCRHYGMNAMPCRPRTPRHKGKVERAVAYVKDNALKGRRFTSLAQENAHLAHWEEQVADRRIHGTTCKQVRALFDLERPHLQPLPPMLFAAYKEARRRVGRDSFVEVERAFYEAPPEYIGRDVWVRWDTRVVRLFNERMEAIQLHTRIEPGRFSRVLGVAGMSRPVLASCRWRIDQAGLLGEACGRWAQAAIDVRGPEALRAVVGLCNLTRKHTAAAINAACARAIEAGTHRLRDVRRLLEATSVQPPLAFADTHPLIRDLSVYSRFVENHQTAPHHEPPDPQTACPHLAPLGAA
jgi:transposase